MKPTILAILAVLAFSVVHAGPELNPLEQVCTAKWNITKHLIETREERSMTEAMKFIDVQWDNVLSELPHFEHVTYVDMKRITEDVYRRFQNGRFRLHVGSEQDVIDVATHEARQCMRQRF